MTLIAAVLAGTIFGFGLAVSEMINPARVIGFLDITNAWDATLILVMAGALAVTVPLFPLILRRSAPLLCDRFVLPNRTSIDAPLLSGAVIFGIGWGIAGLCPGPALAGLVSGLPGFFIFVAAMIAGQWCGWIFETLGAYGRKARTRPTAAN